MIRHVRAVMRATIPFSAFSANSAVGGENRLTATFG